MDWDRIDRELDSQRHAAACNEAERDRIRLISFRDDIIMLVTTLTEAGPRLERNNASGAFLIMNVLKPPPLRKRSNVEIVCRAWDFMNCFAVGGDGKLYDLWSSKPFPGLHTLTDKGRQEISRYSISQDRYVDSEPYDLSWGNVKLATYIERGNSDVDVVQIEPFRHVRGLRVTRDGHLPARVGKARLIGGAYNPQAIVESWYGHLIRGY